MTRKASLPLKDGEALGGSGHQKLTEADFQTQVIALARLRAFLVFHPYLSIRSEPGFPDLFLLRQDRTLFRELKTDSGKVTAAQQRWLDLLRLSGHDADVWRPADLRSGRIVRELAPAWQAA